MNKENSCNRMLSRFILIVCCILSACHSNEKRDILSLYPIAVDEGKHRIFLLVKNEEGAWTIVSNAI